MKEWKIYTLGNLCTITSSKRIFAEEYQSTGVPFYRGKEVIELQKGASISSELFISEERYNEIKNKHGVPRKGEMLLTSVGTLGIPYVIGNERFYFKDGNLTWFRNFNEIIPQYLYYWFLSPAGRAQIDSKAIGSTQKALTIDCLSKFEIVIPPLKEQKRIVSILESIDNKIRTNQAINDNLEQQAQALYKSWFVDFEPFKDGEFVDSELGLIPKGWQVGTYEQIIQTTISGDWGKDIMTGNYTHKVACVRGCDFQDMSIGVRGKTPERYILEKNYQAKRLIDNDVIVEISGGTSTISTGRVCLINDDLLGKYNNDIVCTNFCKVVRPIQSYGAYLYYSWKYKYDCRVMFGYENGTSGIKNFQISDFLSKEPVIIPSESSIKEFQTIIDTLQNNIQTNGSEIMKLESLRDSLLPKLMSGELEINKIDC